MKKFVSTLLILCLLLIFASCGRIAADNEGMVQIIAEENGISGELLTKVIGTVEHGDVLLMCVATGNEYQGHQYYAAEFKQKEDNYEFVHSYKLYERGIDMYSLMWADGYFFLSNNIKSKSLQILFLNGEKENMMIAVDEVPFVYYLDLSEMNKNKATYSFEYHFLNEKGEAISQ
jgi:hypothetical protein